MKAEVVDLGPCKKRLTVEVEVEKVKEQYDETCGELGRNVLLPGFRKGRVPRTLLISKFGKQIDADVKAKLLDTSFKDAVKEKELEPVGEPDLDVEKVEFHVEKPLKYDCEIEVKPEFDPPDCEGLKLEKPSEEVADDDVDEAIDRIRRRFAQVHPVEGPAEAEDFVTVDVRLDIDGQEAWKDSELPLGLMEERALGLPFEVPSEKFIGLEAGKGFSTEVEVPMNFKIEEYRGKKGVAEIEVKDVKRPRLPDLDDEFAKRMGEPGVDGLRLRVRGSLVDEKKNSAQAELRRQVIDQLIAGVEFELPEKLLAAAAERDELRRRYHLEQMGVRGDALSDDARQEMRNVSRQQAERDLRGFLILEKIAKIRDLEPGDEEVDGHFAAMAAHRGVDPDALKHHAEEHGELESVKAELRERKVMEFIISKAKITEKPPEKKAKKTKAPPAKKAEKAETPAKPAKPASGESAAGKKKSVRTTAVKDEKPAKPEKKKSVRTKAVKDEKPVKKPAKKKSVRAKAVKDDKPAKKTPKKAAKKSAKKSDKKK